MSDSKTGMFKPILDKSKTAGAVLSGFMAGHLAFNNAVPTSFRTGMQGTIAALVIFVAGLFVATKVKNEHIQNGLIGLSTYSGIKALNNLTTLAPAVNGLGAFALPQAAVDFIHKITPNLGEPEPVAWNNQNIPIYNADRMNGIDAIEQTYEVVDSQIRGIEAYEPDLGNSAYSIKAA